MTTKVSTNQNAENQLPRRSVSHSENVPDPTNQNTSSLKTSFLRRFNRLSAKTRTKYRNELRRSNSLLDLRTNQRSRSESIERTNHIQDDSMRMRMDQSEGGTGLQDWIGRRLRNRGSTNQRAQSHSETISQMNPNQKVQTLPALNSGCTYVGNTLLKQKPRLRVRQSANQNSENIIFPSTNQDADNTSQDTLSMEDRIPDYDPRQIRGRSNSCSQNGNSGPRGGTSGSELSDMEQVLFRAARLRSRRVRSASNETRGTDRTSQLDNYSLTQTVTGSAGGSAGFDDSDSHPGDDDSFLIYGSCAKTYNERIKNVAANQKIEICRNQNETNPELVSLSTEYDPNFSTSSESGVPPSGNSSGYGGSAGSSSGYNSSEQNQPIKDHHHKSHLAKELLADKVIENNPTNEIIVNRVETFEPIKNQESFRQKSKPGLKSEENSGSHQTTEQNDKSDKPSLFYVALVGNDKKIKNANYRVRSGYIGPTMKNGQIGEYEYSEIKKSNSMSEVRESRMSGGYCEGVIDATYCQNDRQKLCSERTQLQTEPVDRIDPNSTDRSGSHRTRLQRGTPMRGSLPANFNRSQTTTNDPVTLNEPIRSHDVSRKNSVGSNQTRRGSSGSNTSFTIKPDNVKVTPTNKDEWKITIKISREKDESDDYRTTSEAESVPGRHTIIREARIKKKIQKENQTQTSPQTTRATSPKTPDTDSEPCMVPHIRQMPKKSGYIPQNMTHTPITHTPLAKTQMTQNPMTQSHGQDQVTTGEGRSGLKMLRTEFAKSGPGGRKDVLPDMPRRCYLTRTQVTPGHVTANHMAPSNSIPTLMKQQQQSHMTGKPKKEGFKSILNKWEDRCHLSRAASVDGLNQPIRSGTFSGTSSRRTSQQSNQSDFRTGLSNAGSDRTSNEPNFGQFQMMNNSSTTSGVVTPTSGDNFRSGEEDEPTNQESTPKKLPPLDSGPIFTRNRPGFQRSSSLQRFGSENSLGNRYNRFDQVGDMGRYSYRPGPIGWKASNY